MTRLTRLPNIPKRLADIVPWAAWATENVASGALEPRACDAVLKLLRGLEHAYTDKSPPTKRALRGDYDPVRLARLQKAYGKLKAK